MELSFFQYCLACCTTPNFLFLTMSLKNKIYNITGGAGRAVLFLLAIPFVVKFMGFDRFGVLALISSVGNIVLILGVGVSTTVTHYVA